MRSDDYKPLGTFRPEQRTRQYGADWKPYTDDPESMWGPNGPLAREGAGTQVSLDLGFYLEGPRS